MLTFFSKLQSYISFPLKMPTETASFSELLSASKQCSLETKIPFQMALQFNSAICKRDRSPSRSPSASSTHSSIIDPGEEKSELSFEAKSPDMASKRQCTEFNNRVHHFENSPDKSDVDPKRLLHANDGSLSPEKGKPVRSFLIKDILSSSAEDSADSKGEPRGFIRPWDTESSPTSYLNQLNMATSIFQSLQYSALSGLHPGLNLFQHPYQAALSNYRIVPNRRPRSADDDSRSERSESDSPESPASNSANNAGSSPLDALFEMTSKAFDRNEAADKTSDPSSDHLNLFNNRASQIKKKRKSRTAFTNHQIFELEKRFLYQKYLSPADRDEIAQSLGLTNAQVITWFQNRRAKLKRDVEEFKKDVDAGKVTGAHTALLEAANDFNLLKKSEIVAALHQHAQHTNN